WRERRDKGLCFSCDEKFHANHCCKNRVMIMCGYEGEDDDVTPPSPAVTEEDPPDESPE
ncbi:hypothetical protein A2U01_0118484, partial [Trifolium medium]|nr:hypothetical protein [Trifolium medium]